MMVGLGSVLTIEYSIQLQTPDLLNKLGQSKYFSMLHLKSGYWQIRVRASKQEKMAFVTHRGLYEFWVSGMHPLVSRD